MKHKSLTIQFILALVMLSMLAFTGIAVAQESDGSAVYDPQVTTAATPAIVEEVGTVIEFGNPPDLHNGNCFPFACSAGTRYQQVYNASMFPGLVVIDKVQFFNTAMPGAIFYGADYEIRLSTTSKLVNGLDTANLSNNVGSDDAFFYAATLSGPTGPVITFDGVDFPYDPSQGNLLIDINRTNMVGGGAGFLDARNGSFGTDSSRAHNYGGGFQSYGLRTAFVIYTNRPPVANPNGPYLGAVNTPIAFDGTGSSDPDGDLLTYAWDFGNASPGTGDTPSHTYTEAGIYDVCLTVTDPGGLTDTVCTTAVVYDPSGGFVTGGGWIDSPSGAYTPNYPDDEDLTGKANFGFVSKYKKGASVPTGNTEFQFHAGDLNFHSNNYDWLVVTGNDYARYKGSGTINGEGDYKFMLWAGDSEPDVFRIKIWTEVVEIVDELKVVLEIVEYDNGFLGSGYENGQPISGGSIIVHTSKK